MAFSLKPAAWRHLLTGKIRNKEIKKHIIQLKKTIYKNIYLHSLD
jgi:hypothetical protein